MRGGKSGYFPTFQKLPHPVPYKLYDPFKINAKKSDMDNLNSPSARFENYEGSENPYGKEAHSWHALVAELSMIAMGAEAAAWKA